MIELSVDDLRLCNCAQCDCELLGEVQAAEFAAGKYRTNVDQPPVVAGRIFGRPFCGTCLSTRHAKGGRRVNLKPHHLEEEECPSTPE